MVIDRPNYSDNIRKGTQDRFAGLNHNPGAGDGEIVSMKNLCSDYSPLLATRNKRMLYRETGSGKGLFSWEKLCWVEGTDFYYDGVKKGSVSNGRKRFAAMHQYIIILPDKKYYDTKAGVFGDMESVFDLSEMEQTITKHRAISESFISIQSGTEEEIHYRAIYPGTSRSIRFSGANWSQYDDDPEGGFTAGNWVKIIGSEVCSGVYKITGSDGDLLGIEDPDYTFEGGDETGTNVKFQLYTPSTMTFEATLVDGESQGVNSFSFFPTELLEEFDVGDVIDIAGSSITANNGRYKIQEIYETQGLLRNTKIRVEANSFTAGSDSTGDAAIIKKTPGDLEFIDGTIYGEPAQANTIRCNGVDWSDYFHVGDAISITDCSIEKNNVTLIIREIEGNELHFYENSFTNGIDSGMTAKLSRTMPELIFAFENENRLWGSDGKTIYASKLGDPFNFNVYDGLDTDSYAVDASSAGQFRGGYPYGGYPTFMKNGRIYKMYGNKPSNFELIGNATLGLAAGSELSLAVAGEALFYLNDNGICMYTGGIPTLISRPFGQERYKNAVGGSDGNKYYVSMEDESGDHHLFVYDTQKSVWHEEDDTDVTGFAYHDGNLYFMDADGGIWITGRIFDPPTGATLEKDFDWFAEFSDFTDNSPNKKGVGKMQIRIELDKDAWCKVKIMMDSDGNWITPKDGILNDSTKRSYYLAIIPERADHYRIRLEGEGGCKVYSMTREYYIGSELRSYAGRQ